MTDNELKQHVQNALGWEPSLDAKDIGISVDEGVVTLRGNVASFSAKMTAERVALRVYGVKAIANDLIVHLATGFERTDTEVAQAAVAALTWNSVVPHDRVTVAVADGRITLSGTVNWNYQKDAVTRALRDLRGVKSITNNIVVQPVVRTAVVRDEIEAAFKRSAEVDARRIAITAQDGKITLNGNVHSWTERREAERAAWAAPGVTQVDDRLVVIP
jgi:osmotically-inducible protein OsmY